MDSSTVTIDFRDKLGVFFNVPSESEKDVIYNVHVFYKEGHNTTDDWICTCPGWKYHHKCKHIDSCKEVLSSE